MLEKCINAIQAGKKTPWSLRTTPKAQFYQLLHSFLKKWTKTRQSTKILIGKLYLAIDENFAGRPDNVYRYVDSLSKAPFTHDLMSYSAKQHSHANSSDCISSLTIEICGLKEKLDLSKKQLLAANCALRDITNEKLKTQKERDSALNKAAKYHQSSLAAMDDIVHLIEELENSEISEELSSVHECGDPTFSPTNSDIITGNNQDPGPVDFTATKSGKTYSNSVRKLYYTLLSNGIPVSRIESLVKDVVKWSNPSVDILRLELPKRSCASYMRKDELKVVSNAHKATSLCRQVARGESLKINSDGTTKNQKKLGGVAINGMAISVNELANGSSLTAINDVSRELEKLRKTAHALGVPNADSINWSLIESSTSDSASTQKRFNCLLQERKEADKETFNTDSEGAHLNFIENFCSMHLGVNIRKAFLRGMHCQDVSGDSSSINYPVDTFVHQFCKVFGKHGTPEYECGVQGFSDFLTIMCEDKSLPVSKLKYYQQCSELRLERQVGNRYFVTAANASIIIFLVSSAIEFMEYTGKHKYGNKLEKAVYQKLKDKNEIVQILADSLMYFHVYADLVMLSKSKRLFKSTLDMNMHYLELKCFLLEAEKHPDIVLEQDYKVFVSEEKLYGNDKTTNHRLAKPAVYETLFITAKMCATPLEPLIVSGSISMHEKLCTYAENQLPGGIYWEPEGLVRKILSELNPSNDLCESLLGLNDYLTTSIPNLHQMSRSNLVEVKKNKTVQWLEDLPSEQQDQVINLAFASKQQIQDECKMEKKIRDEERRRKMIRGSPKTRCV